MTLILGLLPLVAGACPVDRGRVGRIGAATIAALLAGALLMADGHLGRLDALILLGGWVAGTVYAARLDPEGAAAGAQEQEITGPGWRHAGGAMVGLVAVGLGATTAVEALTRLAGLWALPEYLVAFTLASVGTSLPELVVEITAVRKGQWQLAIGDALGSSFVDSTLSLAIGPIIRPITILSQLALSGSLIAAAALGLTVVILTSRKAHDWRSGVGLIIIFVLVYLLLGNLGW